MKNIFYHCKFTRKEKIGKYGAKNISEPFLFYIVNDILRVSYNKFGQKLPKNVTKHNFPYQDDRSQGVNS